MQEDIWKKEYRKQILKYDFTYYNYFGITPDKNTKACNSLVSLRLNMCLMHYAGVSDESLLPKVDFAKAFAGYLLSHGMSQQQLDALVQALR